MIGEKNRARAVALLLVFLLHAASLSAGEEQPGAARQRATAGIPDTSLDIGGFVQPEYPGEAVIRWLRWAVPLSLVVSAALTLNEAVNPGRSAAPVAPELASAGAVSFGLLGMEIAFRSDRRRFRDTVALNTAAFSPIVSYPSESVDSGVVPVGETAAGTAAQTVTGCGDTTGVDTVLLGLARSAATRAELDSALEAYDALIERVPGSPHLPEALYEAALIRLGLGKHREAEVHLTRLSAEFPDDDVAYRSAELLETLRSLR